MVFVETPCIYVMSKLHEDTGRYGMKTYLTLFDEASPQRMYDGDRQKDKEVDRGREIRY